MRIAMYQMLSQPGRIKTNIGRIQAGLLDAQKKNAHVVIFPESATLGYPPFKLLNSNYQELIQANQAAVQGLANLTVGLTAVIGYVRQEGSQYFNSAAILQNGKYLQSYDKRHLVKEVNEGDHFTPGRQPYHFSLGKISFWVSICQDLWDTDQVDLQQIRETADVILSINASHHDFAERRDLIADRAKRADAHLFYVNAIGRFNGQSMVIDPNGEILSVAKEREEGLIVHIFDA